MRDISRRLKNVEKKLNLNEKPITITIVEFGIGKDQLPPDRIEENTTIHFVRYDDIAKQ